MDKSKQEKHNAMQSYFDLETWLYGQGKDKPLEIKSAMLLGGLWVLHHANYIDWDTMREMYGEFMSKQIGLR